VALALHSGHLTCWLVAVPCKTLKTHYGARCFLMHILAFGLTDDCGL
jgi:hypothetical protein